MRPVEQAITGDPHQPRVRQIEGRWKQVHHHGSIEAPELLARYQSAVLGMRVHSQGT
jgi:hypothetical protein